LGSPIGEKPHAGNLRDRLDGFVFLHPLAQLSLDLGNLRVQDGQPIPLLTKCVDQHRGQTICNSGQHIGNCLVQSSSAPSHCFTIFGQQSAQAIDLHRAELHQLLAHAMQREHRLLGLGLHRNRFAWLLHCQPDCACIGCIVLVADIERFDELGRHQLDLVTHARQRSCPVLRTAACFHANQAMVAIGKELQERGAPDRFAHDFSCRRIHEMDLKDALCNINPNGHKLHLGSSGCL
jgi:hypothetical protein